MGNATGRDHGNVVCDLGGSIFFPYTGSRSFRAIQVSKLQQHEVNLNLIRVTVQERGGNSEVHCLFYMLKKRLGKAISQMIFSFLKN